MTSRPRRNAWHSRRRSRWTQSLPSKAGSGPSTARHNAAEQLFADRAGVIDNFLVKDLKALIVSRTCHVPMAKNNTGDAMLIEARAACVANAASRCPPVAPHDETSVNVDADGVNGDGANSVNGDGAHGYDANDDGDGEGEDKDSQPEVDEMDGG
jgi:hypothetical protein